MSSTYDKFENLFDEFLNNYNCETFIDLATMCRTMSKMAEAELEWEMSNEHEEDYYDYYYDEETLRCLKEIIPLSSKLADLWLRCDNYYRP